MLKKFLTSLLLASSLCASASAAPTNPPDGLVDAMLGCVPGHPYGVTFFTATPQTDGTVAAVFIVQGVGKWTLFEVCPDSTTRIVATGIDDVDGDRIHVVILPADGKFCGCFIQATNMHGYAFPTL